MDFGEKIKELREAKGMTQQNLADLLFVTRQTVSRWEGGSRYPDLVTAKNLADILDTTVDTLMADDTAMNIEQRSKAYGRFAGKIETMVIALCVAVSLGNLFFSCWWLRDCVVEELFTADHWYFPFLSVIDILFSAFFALMLISSMIKTIRKELPIGKTGILGVVFFIYRGLADLILVLLGFESRIAADPVTKPANSGYGIMFALCSMVCAGLSFLLAYFVYRFLISGRMVSLFLYILAAAVLLFLNLNGYLIFGGAYSEAFVIPEMILFAMPLNEALCIFFGIVITIGTRKRSIFQTKE
ncbi:MAG: helix-turn-helix transcriptional regulator [Clostridiales bacterium]|nr:helix-turn-helix transcriptional regulator [Clostridiales bacterium]